MGLLRKAESGLDRAFSGIFRRRTNVQLTPVLIAEKLIKEMEDGRIENSSFIYVPHEYTVYLCPQDWERYEARAISVARQLETYLLERARKERYRMLAPPIVTLTCDEQLKPGQFGIGRNRVNLSERDGVELADSAARASAQKVKVPLLVLKHGRHTQVFETPRVLMGRAEDVDFRIEDPSVSRRHAVLLWDRGRLYLRDLGSTNGTFLNGQSVSNAVVRHGDVIRLGGSELRVELG